MCGIIGYINNKTSLMKHYRLSTIEHRGPDDKRFFKDKDVYLGHTRLGIIDPSQAHQPMISNDKRFVITYNGEIYNYKKIKDKLLDKNYEFKTNSDTEVLLYGYIEYKEKIVHELDGMYAFGVWDSLEKRLFVARDPIGIKPFYYVQNKELFAFASEIKALKNLIDQNQLNHKALIDYFKFGYVSKGQTIYSEIKELKPGYCGIVEKGIWTKKQYWIINGHQSDPNSVEQLLKKSINKRMISDVPYGVFLSGGVDSSFILSEMYKLKGEGIPSFCIGFHEDRFNEVPFAKKVANYFKSDFYSLIFTEKDLLENLEKYIVHLDQPQGDPSVLATFLLSQLASNHVKMVLSGEGGDEMFYGYSRYKALKISSLFLNDLFQMNCEKWLESRVTHCRQLSKFLHSLGRESFEKYYQWISTGESWLEVLQPHYKEQFHFSDLSIVLKENFEHNKPLKAAQLFDLFNYLPSQLLKKVDMSSMYHGLEVRVPFLDKQLIETMLSYPESENISFFKQKILLRKIIQKNLPKKLVRKNKKGFSIPLDEWFRNKLKGTFRMMILDDDIGLDQYLSLRNLEDRFNAHLDGHINIGKTLWIILVFGIWLKNN